MGNEYVARVRALFGHWSHLEPFDFQTYEFTQVDIDGIAERLKLQPLAEANGKANIPAADDTELDGPQEKIVHYMEGKVSEVSTKAEVENHGYRTRIAEIDIASGTEKIASLPANLKQQLEDLVAEARGELDAARSICQRAKKELDSFRSRFALTRDPQYPESRLVHISWLIWLTVLEAATNAWFFAQGSSAGLLGGTTLALLVAVLDILIVFSLGRWLVWYCAPQKLNRMLGVVALASFPVWAVGYNLLVAHIREGLLRTGIATGVGETFFSQPFGLERAESWILFGLGLFYSVAAVIDGVRWDDSLPGYGAVYRRFVTAREDVLFHLEDLRAGALASRDKALEQLEYLWRRVEAEHLALGNAIDAKKTLQRNIKKAYRHYEVSVNTLLQIYRDENRKHRSEPPPAYFGARVSTFPLSLVEENRTGEQTRLEAAERLIAEGRDVDCLAQILTAHRQVVEQLGDLERDFLGDELTFGSLESTG